MKVLFYIIGKNQLIAWNIKNWYFSASVTATFDINGYISGMNSAGGSAVPFGQFESTSNEEYKNLMANYLDKNVRGIFGPITIGSQVFWIIFLRDKNWKRTEATEHKNPI